MFINVGEFYKQFYIRKEEVPIIVLLPEELHFLIYNDTFEMGLTPQLRKVKDFFVFGCTVALRFSDLVQLKETNIRIVADRWYLSIKARKTGQETRIRLPEYAINIVKKYNTQKGGFILPRYNIVNLNLYIKKLLEQAGFNAGSKKVRSRRGEFIEIFSRKKQYRFCDLVTTHTMRRTAITTMLCLGMPEHIVRRISGHSPMSREFFRYVFLAQSYQDAETEMVFDKLKHVPQLSR
jgi:integrase